MKYSVKDKLLMALVAVIWIALCVWFWFIVDATERQKSIEKDSLHLVSARSQTKEKYENRKDLPCLYFTKKTEKSQMDRLEHPEITRAERTGYPDNRKDEDPTCPICGAVCDDIYKDRDGEIFGCDNCIQKCQAWEVM